MRLISPVIAVFGSIALFKNKLRSAEVIANSGYWSSSFKSDDPDKVIVLYSFYYNILEFRDIKKDYGLVKCVRNIE